MNVEVLVSTMNITSKDDFISLISNMNISGKSTIINQVDLKSKIVNCSNDLHNFLSYRERGLSKSRNCALKNSSSEFILLADDDMVYVDNYQDIVNDAFLKFPDADIIAFYVESENINNVKQKLNFGKIGFLKSFKIQSVQLCFRRDKLIENNLLFDENFGAGAKLYMGEENIFLCDCLKKGLKIFSCPITIAKLKDRESTWFKGYDNFYFEVKGACFYRISKFLSVFLCLQFLIRKYSLYSKNISFFKALCSMRKGIINYKYN